MDKKDKIEFNPQEFEAKWQTIWESDKVFAPDLEHAQKPYMNLMMFPYPSAEGLHVGNVYAQTGADVYGRLKRMQGYDVYVPMGLDGFGIHSENYALKVGVHPVKQAKITQERFYKQMKAIGTSVDWSRTLETYDPVYYRWTQWLFIQLFKAGLAYRKKAEVNWCPSCKTVLSDEQVVDGKCERCSSAVEKRELEQWFFRITDYADRLLGNIEKLDWTEKVKIAQKNWIGKKTGAVIEFPVILNDSEGSKDSSALPQNDNVSIDVFTTRPDTLYGATFLVVAPEHPFVAEILRFLPAGRHGAQDDKRHEVKDYIKLAKSKSNIERTSEDKEKTGVFSGMYAVNPINQEKIPVWVADYVLSSYGTGAIMAVPAHDSRDYEFAKKYKLPIRIVIASAMPDGRQESQDSGQARMTGEIASSNTPRNDVHEAYVGGGVLVNSGNWNGFKMPKDMGKVLDSLEKLGVGKKEANYHLRDWLISRQRYWGPPIPMLYCSNCAENGKGWFDTSKGKTHREFSISNLQFSNSEEWNSSGWYPVSEEDLPVLLPDVEDWKPLGTGKAPLANHPEFYETTCPSCGGKAVRETDVSDTFLDSAWYFLGYISPSITDITEKEKSAETASRDIKKDQMSNVKCQMSNAPWDPMVARQWLPVKKYIGGAEHSVLHLLYSRFITMVLHDLKLVDFEEPFGSFFAHGLIIKDGAKMSKSRGNVVVPDAYIEKYGADTLRTYLMFLGPFSQGGDFRDSGIEGMHRFIRRIWNMFTVHSSHLPAGKAGFTEKPSEESLRMMHKTVKKVTEDIETFKYNTAISALMEWYNFLSSKLKVKSEKLTREEVEVFLKLFAPFAPYMTEELWARVAGSGLRVDKTTSHEPLATGSIHLQAWPEFDEKYLVSDEMTIVVQVNGKKRAELVLPLGDTRGGSLGDPSAGFRTSTRGGDTSKLKDEEKIKAEARLLIEKYLVGKEPKKVIYIPGKIVNFVV